MELLVVGAGPMAIEHVRAAQRIGIRPKVVCRSEESASRLKSVFPAVSTLVGGLTAYLRDEPAPQSAIIAVPVEDLSHCTAALLRAGTGRVLVEKPGAVGLESLSELNTIAAEVASEVFVGYNRRFLPSVQLARRILEEDGGATSLHFKFSERLPEIHAVGHSEQVLKNWFLCNSSHVADLSFFLVGPPVDTRFFVQGSTEWHPGGATFAGAGITNNGTVFSYEADWHTQGSWMLEISTSTRRLRLSPLERLLEHDGAAWVDADPQPVADNQDAIKPGILEQDRAFLEGRDDNLCSLEDQLLMASIYSAMSGE